MTELERLGLQIKWLRWGLEEIVRGTDPRAGNGHLWEFGVAMGAIKAAGFPVDTAGIQKPTQRLDTEGGS